MLLQKYGDGRLTGTPLGHADHEIVERILVSIDFDPVHFEKGQRGCNGGSLISIQERVVSTNPVKIRSGHGENSLVKKRIVEGCFDASHRVR